MPWVQPFIRKINLKEGIVIANIGDASMGCGPVWEAMNMAAMDQTGCYGMKPEAGFL